MVSLKAKLKAFLAKTAFSYDKALLKKSLEKAGLGAGDAVMVHSSWLKNNGFQGKPVDFINGIKEVVGSKGLVTMTSMTYHNQSTAEFLGHNKPVNLKRTPSAMGLLTEIFRRGKEVVRSMSPAHPILAWGEKADWFIEGHEHCEYSFGVGSPFEKLLEMNGKILCVDTPFANITFTHFLEDRIASTLPFDLYETEPMEGVVIDQEGQEHIVTTKVLNQRANALRREERLIAELAKHELIKRFRVGNTRFLLLGCREMTECVDNMVAEGRGFFDEP